MGRINVPLHQAFSGLSTVIRSVDVRVAAYRGRVAQPPTDDWRPLRTVIRVSYKDRAALGADYAVLERELGSPRTQDFAIFHDVIAASDLPRIAPGHCLTVAIVDDRIDVTSVPLDPQPGARVSRYREHSGPIRPEQWPMIEYFYTPEPIASSWIDLTYLEASVRRELGFPSATALMNSHLQVHETSGRPGSMCVQMEMPAQIAGVELHGSVLELHVVADLELDGVRLFVTTLRADGVSIARHQSVPLTPIRVDGLLRLLRGETQLDQVDLGASIECVLTHPHLPELDDVSRRIRDLIPVRERNPLLACLRQFWDFEALGRIVEKPYRTKTRRVDLTPQAAFQAGIAHLLTLAGFQTVDLGTNDLIRAPETRVEIATADILAYHAATRLLLVAACTINVPRGEDYEKVLHAAAILGEQFEEGSRVRIIPALFTGQEPDSMLVEQAGSRRLTVFTRQEISQLRSYIEDGQEQRLLSFLTGPNAEL